MPLHDHPNMAVFFRLVFGGLSYTAFDKVEDKFKYNQFSEDEYLEMLDKKTRVKAKKSRRMGLKEGDLLFVRPSNNNMHEFVATENSCFFDICLPNYTPNNPTRRITYFNEDEDQMPDPMKAGTTELIYDTTPPHMPPGFDLREIDYRGSYM